VSVSDLVLSDVHERVMTLTLNQPQRRNALSMALLDALQDQVRGAERDATIRAVVLTGAGVAFSSGADLSEFSFESGEQPPVADLLRGRLNPIVVRLRTMDKPVLAAVNGVAAGAGMSLALACDIRYAAESARFVLAFVGIGLVPDAGTFYFLPRLIGPKALELAWTGQPVDAKSALELGMLNEVLPDGDVLSHTQAVAAKLARGPQHALALIKRGMNQAHELPLDRVLEMEAQYQAIAASEPDFAEGVAAFREKREPRFA